MTFKLNVRATFVRFEWVSGFLLANYQRSLLDTSSLVLYIYSKIKIKKEEFSIKFKKKKKNAKRRSKKHI